MLGESMPGVNLNRKLILVLRGLQDLEYKSLLSQNNIFRSLCALCGSPRSLRRKGRKGYAKDAKKKK